MSLLSKLDRLLGTNLRKKPYLIQTRKSRRKQPRSDGISKKKFKHISPEELTNGVYAVPVSRTTAESITQRGNVTETDHTRVVGKGYRIINNIKHEALLFENGTWDLSNYYMRLQHGNRPPTILNRESARRSLNSTAPDAQTKASFPQRASCINLMYRA